MVDTYFLSPYQHNRDSGICIFNFMGLKWESNKTVDVEITNHAKHDLFIPIFICHFFKQLIYIQTLCQAAKIQTWMRYTQAFKEFSV